MVETETVELKFVNEKEPETISKKVKGKELEKEVETASEAQTSEHQPIDKNEDPLVETETAKLKDVNEKESETISEKVQGKELEKKLETPSKAHEFEHQPIDNNTYYSINPTEDLPEEFKQNAELFKSYIKNLDEGIKKGLRYKPLDSEELSGIGKKLYESATEDEGLTELKTYLDAKHQWVMQRSNLNETQFIEKVIEDTTLTDKQKAEMVKDTLHHMYYGPYPERLKDDNRYIDIIETFNTGLIDQTIDHKFISDIYKSLIPPHTENKYLSCSPYERKGVSRDHIDYLIGWPQLSILSNKQFFEMSKLGPEGNLYSSHTLYKQKDLLEYLCKDLEQQGDYKKLIIDPELYDLINTNFKAMTYPLSKNELQNLEAEKYLQTLTKFGGGKFANIITYLEDIKKQQVEENEQQAKKPSGSSSGVSKKQNNTKIVLPVFEAGDKKDIIISPKASAFEDQPIGINNSGGGSSSATKKQKKKHKVVPDKTQSVVPVKENTDLLFEADDTGDIIISPKASAFEYQPIDINNSGGSFSSDTKTHASVEPLSDSNLPIANKKSSVGVSSSHSIFSPAPANTRTNKASGSYASAPKKHTSMFSSGNNLPIGTKKESDSLSSSEGSKLASSAPRGVTKPEDLPINTPKNPKKEAQNLWDKLAVTVLKHKHKTTITIGAAVGGVGLLSSFTILEKTKFKETIAKLVSKKFGSVLTNAFAALVFSAILGIATKFLADKAIDWTFKDKGREI